MLTTCYIIDNKLCSKDALPQALSGLLADPRRREISFSANSSSSFPHGLDGARAKVDQFEDIRREYEFGAGTIKGVAR